MLRTTLRLGNSIEFRRWGDREAEMPLHESQVDVAFDATQLQQRCLNNLDLARHVTQAFLVHGAEYVAEVDRFATAKQWTDVASAAHRLKGASQNVSAGQLAQKAAELESSAKRNPESLNGAVAELWEAWQGFQAQAGAFLNSIPGADSQRGDN